MRLLPRRAASMRTYCSAADTDAAAAPAAAW
jgi:hypothetical protein